MLQSILCVCVLNQNAIIHIHVYEYSSSNFTIIMRRTKIQKHQRKANYARIPYGNGMNHLNTKCFHLILLLLWLLIRKCFCLKVFVTDSNKWNGKIAKRSTISKENFWIHAFSLTQWVDTILYFHYKMSPKMPFFFSPTFILRDWMIVDKRMAPRHVGKLYYIRNPNARSHSSIRVYAEAHRNENDENNF